MYTFFQLVFKTDLPTALPLKDKLKNKRRSADQEVNNKKTLRSFLVEDKIHLLG